MGYRGQTFRISRDHGGFVGNQNANGLPSESLVIARNVNIDGGDIRRRGGTSRVLNANGLGLGISDFINVDKTQDQVLVTAPGIITTLAGAGLKGSWAISGFADFEVFNDKIYICGGEAVPQVWDGAAGSTVDLANVPTSWTASNFPKQIVKHGRLNSMRLWAIGCGPSAKPFTVYASKLNEDDFSDGEVTTIVIETGDGTGVIAIAEFGDRLFCFSKNDTFIIDDSDIDEDNWGYFNSPFKGGAAHHKLIVHTPNDLIAMREDGDIYSISAMERYGDYRVSSLTRDAFIHDWIKSNVNLSHIDKFHSIYDPGSRRIYFFVVRTGQSQVDTALVFSLDKAPKEAWVIHDGLDNPDDSGYNAAIAGLVKVGPGDHRVYTFTYGGDVWKLGEVAVNDRTDGYKSSYKTPKLDFGLPRTRKQFKRIKIFGKSFGGHIYDFDWKVDGVPQAQKTFTFDSGSGFLLNDATRGILNSNSLADEDDIVETKISLNVTGKRLEYEISNSNANENFQIYKELIDHKPLGVQP